MQFDTVTTEKAILDPIVFTKIKTPPTTFELQSVCFLNQTIQML